MAWQEFTLDSMMDAIKDLKSAPKRVVKQEVSQHVWSELLKITTVRNEDNKTRDVFLGMPVVINPMLPDNCAVLIHSDGKREVVKCCGWLAPRYGTATAPPTSNSKQGIE